VASAASVSKGLVYVHFASKEALLTAVLERAVKGWTAATRDGSAAGAPSAAGVIAGGVRASVGYVARNPILMEILSQDLEPALLSGDVVGRRDLPGLYIDTTRLVVEHGISTGEFRPGIDAASVAEVVWLIHDGLVRQLTSAEPARSRAEIDQLVDSAVDLFTDGLLAKTREA
jgi:AcrR family transcriptional regulator